MHGDFLKRVFFNSRVCAMASEFLAHFDAETIKNSIPTMRINSQNMNIDKIIDLSSFAPQHAAIAETIMKKLARSLFPSRMDSNETFVFFGRSRIDFEYFIESHWLFCFVLSKIWNSIPVYCKKTSLYFSMPVMPGLNCAREVYRAVLSPKGARLVYFSLQTVQYVEQIAIVKNSGFQFPRATQMTYKGCSKRFLKDKQNLLWAPKNRQVFEKDERYMKNLYYALLLLGFFADEVLTTFGSGIDLQNFLGRIAGAFLRTRHGFGVDFVITPLKDNFFLVGGSGRYRAVRSLRARLPFSTDLLDSLRHARCLRDPSLLWGEATRAVGRAGRALRLCALRRKAVLSFHGYDLEVGRDVCIEDVCAGPDLSARYKVAGRCFVASEGFFRECVEQVLGARILKTRVLGKFMNCMQCILYVKSCLSAQVPGLFWAGLSETRRRRCLCVTTRTGIM